MRILGRVLFAAALAAPLPIATTDTALAADPSPPPASSPAPVYTVEPGSVISEAAAPTDFCEHCPQKRCQFTIGARTWISWGQSTWGLAGVPIVGAPIDPVSELKWRNLDSTIFETNFDAVVKNRFVAHVDLGVGGVSGGYMDDYDYLADDRAALGSLSRSRVADDDLFYVNADFGLRIICRPKLTVDALVGYQYWREEYVASDTLQLFVDGPFEEFTEVGAFTPGPTIREKWERHSIRVGLRGEYQIGECASLQSRVLLVPWAHNRMVDNHLTGVPRTFTSKGDGGFGVMWDFTAAYKLTPKLSIEAGYQLWYQDVDHGHISVQPGNGSFDLKELSTFRHGILVGVKWRF